MASAALVFAGKSVAAPIIKEIVTKAFSYLGGFFSEKSMQELKDKLNRGMPKIQAVLDVVSPDQYKDKSQALDDWFWQLRDAVEEAEDAIDELEYYELEEKANDRKIEDWGSSFGKMKHRVAKSVKHVSVLDKVAKQFTHRDTIKRLKKAMESLDKAAADVTDILQVTEFLNNGPASGNGGSMNNGRETGSMLTAPKFVGREVEKERITEWLTRTTPAEEPEIVPSTSSIPILSIVGHGGMGKTTLVQSILENKDFKDFKTIWVTVSTNFDATSLISKILESVTRTEPSAKHLEPLQRELEKELLSVKYLLILDDVWEENKRDELEKLFAPLRTGKSGSKILLTTRMTSVAELAANVMGVKSDRLTLEGLKEDQSLELFNHHVFSGLNSKEYEHLKLIGEQIVRKLGGCPLVTKVASAALQGNMTSSYWSTFLHKSLQHFIGTKDDIMGVLRLSYYDLSTELQILFRYCSLFPQDKEFEKKELVQLWIGSGLILPPRSNSLTLVGIGEHYLDCLTRKSFFELKYRVDYWTGANEEYYLMHDLIHDLATNVSSGECARITDPHMFEKEKDTVRHLLIEGMDSLTVSDVNKIYRFKNLRTIIVGYDYFYDYGKDTVSAVERIVESSKSLRLFHSNLLRTSPFGNKLGNLKHLRYIRLCRTSPELMSNVVKLYHLMVLISTTSLLSTKKVRYLGNLDRLRYINIGSEFPVSRLSCLQELNHYRVQGSIGNKISSISDLRDLRELGLYCLENVNNQEEASSAKLNEKQYLNSLSLGWTECMDSEAGVENSELVLDHLQPHDNIQKLKISGYMGLKFPCWIEKPCIKSLVSLRMEKCINWEYLPFLAGLVLLKNLELVGLRKLQQIFRTSHMFGTISVELLLPQSLQRLKVNECSELRELPILPPGLNRLDIRKCPILKELPILPPSLVTLSVEHAGLTMLPMVGKIFTESTETKASRLEDIYIRYCQHLTSLEGSLLEQKLCLGSLERLNIEGCKNLESASIPFEEISGLRELKILGSPKLTIMRSAGDKLLPSSLTEIRLGPCCYLDLPLQSLQGFTELSTLDLCNCLGLVSLPSADVFKSLTSLRFLGIWDCGDLSSLGGLRGSLQYLYIRGCSKLVGTPDASVGKEGNLLQIDSVNIDLPCLLLVEPLKSLCHTRSLVIYDGSEMEALPERWLLQNRASLQSLQIEEAKSLESLPSSMRDLSCLELLVLRKVEQLKSLPDLPPGLRRLLLSESYLYLKKLKEYGNPERHKISHIHRMEIGGSYFIMGKECSEETYGRLRYSDDDAELVSWAEQQKGYKRVVKRMLTGCSGNTSKGLSHFK